MTIQHRAGNSGNAGSSTNITVAWSSLTGHASGDIAFIWLVADYNEAGDATVSGFTQIDKINHATDTVATWLLYRVLDGSESGNITIPPPNSTSGARAATVSVFYDDASSSPTWTHTNYVKAESGSSSATHTTGAINIAAASELVAFFSNDSALTVTTPPSGMTQSAFNNAQASIAAAAYYEHYSGSGSGVTKSIVWSTTDNGAQIALELASSTASAPVLSTPVESSIGAESATLGCTTDTASGTMYAVASVSSSDTSGITNAQVVANHYADNSTADYYNSSAVTTTSPSVALSSMFAAGTYEPGTVVYYALAQSGGSNVLTDSFTLLAGSITGADHVKITTPDADSSHRITASGDIATGNILAWGNIQGTGTVTVAADGTFSADSGVIAFDVQCWDGSAWGGVGTQTITGDSSSRTIVKTPTGDIFGDIIVSPIVI